MNEQNIKQKAKIVLIVMMAIIFILLLIFIVQTIKLQKLEKTKNTLAQDSLTLAQNEQNVDAETTYRESDEFLEDYSRQELDMGGSEDYLIE